MAFVKQTYRTPNGRSGLRGRLFVYSVLLSAIVHGVSFHFLYQQPVMREEMHGTVESYKTPSIRIVLNQVAVTPEKPEPQKMKEEEPVQVLIVEESPAEFPVPVEEVVELVDEDPAPDDIEEILSKEEVAVSAEMLGEVADTYWGNVCRCIARSIRYPKRARAGRWSGLVVVHLIVEENGEVTGQVVDEETVRPQLASAVMQAIRRASPVSPPPPEMGAPVEANLPIRFSL